MRLPESFVFAWPSETWAKLSTSKLGEFQLSILLYTRSERPWALSPGTYPSHFKVGLTRYDPKVMYVSR